MSILTKVIKDGGGTIIEPFTSSINSVGNTVLTVKYQAKTGEVNTEKVEICKDSNAVLTVKYQAKTGEVNTEKVEICKDSNAVDARFQATINDAKARGYSGDIGTGGNWNGVNTNTNKVFVIAKANDLLQVMSIESSA